MLSLWTPTWTNYPEYELRGHLSAQFPLPLTLLVLSAMQPCYIFFRRKYDRDSNYRLFVMLLASFDMGMSIAHVIKEQFRLRSIYDAGDSIFCPITNYVGHSIGIGTIFMVLFIAIGRFKKICTPFKPQFTKKQSSVICA